MRLAAGAAACAALAARAAPVRADQIVTDTVNYNRAKIVGLEGAELRFRSADGKLQTVWIDEARLLIVDRAGFFDDFNQAERFFAGDEPVRAIPRYRRALRSAEGFWQDVAASRLVLAGDAAKQPDTAVQSFVRVLSGRWAGPAAGARLVPTAIPTKPGKRTARAIEQLDTALSKNPDAPRRALLEILRYDILRQTGDERAAEVARTIAELSIPADARSQRVYEVQLEALRVALADDAHPVEMSALNRAIRDCPKPVLPGLLVLKGQTLLKTASAPEDVIRASWPFMRVAIHFPDDSRAAEGLYGAALALERLGRRDKAMGLLKECLGHKGLTDQTRQTAEAAMRRMQADDASPPG